MLPICPHPKPQRGSSHIISLIGKPLHCETHTHTCSSPRQFHFKGTSCSCSVWCLLYRKSAHALAIFPRLRQLRADCLSPGNTYNIRCIHWRRAFSFRQEMSTSAFVGARNGSSWDTMWELPLCQSLVSKACHYLRNRVDDCLTHHLRLSFPTRNVGWTAWRDSKLICFIRQPSCLLYDAPELLMRSLLSEVTENALHLRSVWLKRGARWWRAATPA